jgi:hypothetical protein
MNRELFVYYRADVQQAQAVATAVAAMQSALRQDIPGLQARVLRRPEPNADSQHTWMETYALDESHHPAGIDDACARLIEARAAVWSELRSGPRHQEVFLACA